MKIVVAVGGNALLRRGQELTAVNQSANILTAARSLAEIGRDHQLIVVHGNGPQIGLLALLDAAVPEQGNFPLDVLSAESSGMIGYPVAQALRNELPDHRVVGLLTQIEVEATDPAFGRPSKPIGPFYAEDDIRRRAAAAGWAVGPDGDGWRRLVPSPAPLRILEIDAIRILVDAGVLLLCAGGGGIPVVVDRWGEVHGVEAVIDKDASAALLAREVDADLLLLLTDAPAVQEGFGTPGARDLRRLTPAGAAALALPQGSMGPKVAAALDFARRTGKPAAIGALDQAAAVLAGEAGTRIVP